MRLRLLRKGKVHIDAEYAASIIREAELEDAAIRHAKRQKMSDEAVAEAIERVRQSRASLALQGAPTAFRPKALPPVNSSDPTPEWQRKAGKALTTETMGKGEVIGLKRYRTKHVIEAHGDKLDMSKRSALERLMQDSTYAMRISVCDPNRGGGFAAPGSRLGGLGNAPQHIRDGHARHEWVWARLSPEMQATANALVTRELMRPDSTPFSMEDFGAQMFPTVKDRNRLWGAAAGALWSLAGGLVFLYGRCPVRVRPMNCEDQILEIMG